MIRKTKNLTIMMICFLLCSCSINQSNNDTSNYNGVYEFIMYDNFGETTAGPLLIFQDQNDDLIFVLTESDIFINIDESDYNEKERKLLSLAKNSDYVKLEEHMMYYLKLDEVKDVSYINSKTSRNPLEVESPNSGFIVSLNNIPNTILIIKNGKVNGKVFNCEQIFADFILKSAKVESNK